MRLALAAGGALLLALLTWLLLRGIDTNASAYADTQRAFDDFALAEASIGRDVLQARAGLLGNYDVLVEAEAAMDRAVSRIRLQVEAEHLDPKPVERLAAAVGQYEDLTERFKSGNALRQNSLAYVGQLSTDPPFGALGDQFAPSATALAAAVLRLSRDSSAESARSLQQQIDRFEAQAPTGGPDGEAAHALLAHARLLTELLPQVDQTLRALVASPTRQPFVEIQELLARAQAASEATAQRSGVLLYVIALGLLVVALRLGQRLWKRSLKIRRLVDANIIGIFIFNADGRIVEANDAFLKIAGYDHEDVRSGRLRRMDLVPAEYPDRDECSPPPEPNLTGSLRPTETEYTRKDGSRVPVLIGAATFEEDGKQGVAFVLDLTERKRAEEALRRSEANLAEAQRLSHTGSWALCPATTKILYWSEECYRIWGFDPVRGLPNRETVWRRIHPGDRDRMYKETQEALQQKSDYKVDFRIMLPDGTVKYLEAIGHHLFSAHGELVQVVGTNVDVTERKRAEEALRESEYRLRQIIETVPSFLWSTDPAGEPTQLNQRMLDYSGMRFEAFLHGGWEAFVHPDDFPETAKDFYHAIQTGTSHQAVNRLRRADGEFRWHHTRAEPLRDEQGHIIQWYGLSVDIDEAKKAEDRLRRSEAYLAEAQRLTHTVTWARSVNRTTLYWSEEGYRLWGLDPQDGPPTRETILQRIHPDDRDRAIERGQEARRQNRDYTHEFRIVLPDGTVKDIQACSRHLFSERGEPVEVLRTYLDVTERKRAEQALREREAKIRRLVDANIIGIFIWDLDGRIIEANDAFLLMVGYVHEDLVSGRIRWTELTPPEWLDHDERRWLPELKMTGSLQPFEKEYFRKDGSRIPVLIGVATFEEGGNQGVSFVVDLTTRKRTEEALRESEAKFRDYAETASDWFWEIGPDYRFTLLSENAFGSHSVDRIGTACWDNALDLETEPEKWRVVWETLDARRPFRDFVYRSVSGNGTPMYVKASGKPVFGTKGEFRGYRGTGTDVTATVRAREEHEKLRQLESDLAHMNRLGIVGEQAASLVHEITQPIASARNNARAALNFLDRQPLDLGEVREALACVVGDADRSGEIIDRIRDHIRKAPLRKVRFDLNDAIDEVILLGRSAIIKNGVLVQASLAERLFPVRGDRVQLQQVILNLVLNAVEAMGAVEAGPRELLISTQRTETHDVLVAVRDSGPGIDPEHVERVFEAFYTTKSSGVGMGLSICRSIIDAHGGRLWAESNDPRGAVFQFTLPGAETYS